MSHDKFNKQIDGLGFLFNRFGWKSDHDNCEIDSKIIKLINVCVEMLQQGQFFL